jgi:hypothetical protein
MTSPRAVSRLLDRAARTREHGLESALPSLVRLRFHFWNPPLRRVGAKAHTLLNRR